MACEDSLVPPPSPDTPSEFPSSISDAPRGGSPGFFFLPPLVPDPEHSGVFDASLEPEVSICRLVAGECTETLVQFGTTAAAGSEEIRVSLSDEHYIVNWHTAGYPVEAGDTVRAAVSAMQTPLGFADIVFMDASQVRRTDSDEFVVLKDGRTLPIRFRIETTAIPHQQEIIGATGGIIGLDGLATLTVTSGVFPSETPVLVSATRSDETSVDFVESGPADPTRRSRFELRVNTADVIPAAPIIVRATVPDELSAGVGTGEDIAVFALIYQSSELDVYDHFERIRGSRFDGSSGVVEFTLDPGAFSIQRTADGTAEAVVVLGVGLVEITEGSSPLLQVVQEACRLPRIASPLDRELEVTGPFNANTPHFGTDFRADGDPVSAVADGEIIRIGFDERPLPRPDPRSGQTVKGWGRYVRILHSDGSQTIYAHLVQESTDHLTPGDQVSAGTVIGLANSTGGVSGPHLHLEYRTPDDQKVDPAECIVSEVGDFSGTWTGTASGPQVGGSFTWILSQEGTSVSGMAFAPGSGTVSGTVSGGIMTIEIFYPATGAFNRGTVRLTGPDQLAGDLDLILPGFTTPFSVVGTRTAGAAAATDPEAADPSGTNYHPDGSRSGG